MKALIDRLHRQKCSCVIANGDDTGCFINVAWPIYTICYGASLRFYKEPAWLTK